MQSALAITHEIYDPQEAARDLLAQIHTRIAPGKNSCGIVFTEPDKEWYAILPYLSEALDCPIIGCTATAQIGSRGYHSLSATLLVMTGEDCVFSSAATGPLFEDGEARLRAAFAEAKAGLGASDYSLAFVFSSQTPDFPDSSRLAVLDELAESRPLFGGTASDYFTFDKSAVFYNGRVIPGGISMLLVGGRVKPKFVVRNIPDTPPATARVTEAVECTIRSIDERSVLDFLTGQGVDVSKPVSLIQAPLVMEPEQGADDGVPRCVPFTMVDPLSGAGSTPVEVLEGTRVAVRMMQRSDIIDTTRDALEIMSGRIAADTDPDYDYSTIIAMTCSGRYVILTYDHIFEGRLVQDILPATLSTAGFYSHGEICPTSVKDGKARNRLHNLSICLCAL